jgi:hypothetical protein
MTRVSLLLLVYARFASTSMSTCQWILSARHIIASRSATAAMPSKERRRRTNRNCTENCGLLVWASVTKGYFGRRTATRMTTHRTQCASEVVLLYLCSPLSLQDWTPYHHDKAILAGDLGHQIPLKFNNCHAGWGPGPPNPTKVQQLPRWLGALGQIPLKFSNCHAGWEPPLQD